MVIVPLILSGISTIIFVLVELLIAPEPVLAPFLLRQKIPILVGLSNFLVALCNFSVTYFFPMWFQTVMLTSASTAGELRVSAIAVAHSYFQDCTCSRTVSRCQRVLSLQGLLFIWPRAHQSVDIL
jgi:hypothetical protein